jgi:MoxR-like ATPase/PAS domain-containing protein
MESLEEISRETLERAANDIGPLDHRDSAATHSKLILINGRRYCPEDVVNRAIMEVSGSQIEYQTMIGAQSLADFYVDRYIPFLSSEDMDSAVQKIEPLISDPSEELAKWISDKDRVYNRFQQVFSPEEIRELSTEELEEFLKPEFNGHWSGFSSWKSALLSDIDTVRGEFSKLIDEERPLISRLDRMRPKNGSNPIKGAAESILTAILHIAYPEKYGVWNLLSVKALEIVGVKPQFKRGASIGEKYCIINEIFKALSHDLDIDLWTLDCILCRLGSKRSSKSGVAEAGIEKSTIPADTRLSAKDAIESIRRIAEVIVQNDLAEKKLGQTDDSEENRKKYQTLIKPLIEEFRGKFSHSPEVYLNNLLRLIAEKTDLPDEYESKGFRFYGQKINGYAWAAVTLKDSSISDRKYSHHPQLYTLVNHEEVRFGFAYGDHIREDDIRITKFRDQAKDRELVRSILQKNQQIAAFNRNLAREIRESTDNITDRLLGDDFSEWTPSVSLVEILPYPDFPDTIVERIEKTLTALLPLFLQASQVTPPPSNTWASVQDQLAYSFDSAEVLFDGLYFPDDIRQGLLTEIRGALHSRKHIILVGPPGTGKSKIAKAICTAVAGQKNYQMCTASPEWSVYETIGGYRQKPDGTMAFSSGAILRSFRDGDSPVNRWLIIDEINRADIDKAFGPLFSALAGDDVVLPFEIDDEPVRLIGQPEDTTPLKVCHYIIHPDWRIIATMNTLDKSSLYEMSYAFMRRFAFIMIDSPDVVDAEAISQYVDAWGFEQDVQRCQQLAELWNLVNRHRKIGPALFKDIYQYLTVEPDASIDSPIAMYLFPQFEGLREEQQREFINALMALPFIPNPLHFKHRAIAFFNIPSWGVSGNGR